MTSRRHKFWPLLARCLRVTRAGFCAIKEDWSNAASSGKENAYASDDAPKFHGDREANVRVNRAPSRVDALIPSSQTPRPQMPDGSLNLAELMLQKGMNDDVIISFACEGVEQTERVTWRQLRERA